MKIFVLSLMMVICVVEIGELVWWFLTWMMGKMSRVRASKLRIALQDCKVNWSVIIFYWMPVKYWRKEDTKSVWQNKFSFTMDQENYISNKFMFDKQTYKTSTSATNFLKRTYISAANLPIKLQKLWLQKLFHKPRENYWRRSCWWEWVSLGCAAPHRSFREMWGKLDQW